MVLHFSQCGRVGHRRTQLRKPPEPSGSGGFLHSQNHLEFSTVVWCPSTRPFVPHGRLRERARERTRERTQGAVERQRGRFRCRAGTLLPPAEPPRPARARQGRGVSKPPRQGIDPSVALRHDRSFLTVGSGSGQGSGHREREWGWKVGLDGGYRGRRIGVLAGSFLVGSASRIRTFIRAMWCPIFAYGVGHER
jgi:hypothetical protein